MSGYDLKEGKYKDKNVTSDELWSALLGVFSPNSHKATTYKFGFLKSIIDNLYNVDINYVLTFDQLFSKFTEIYWNLILKYNLLQKPIDKNQKESKIEKILYGVQNKYSLKENIPFESLSEQIKQEIISDVKKECKKNVVGALFYDTQMMFYSFSKSEEWIQINPQMYDFICKHKLMIEKINYFEWAKFLEKVNSETTTPQLLSKLDASSKRNNLSIYRQILQEEFGFHTCFYCGKNLKQSKIEVDHFIPWAFIKDDNIWNFVLACPECNRSKSDKLPDLIYLDALIERNDHLLLDYIEKNNIHYNNNTLRHIYEWAKLNGYNKTWKKRSYCKSKVSVLE